MEQLSDAETSCYESLTIIGSSFHTFLTNLYNLQVVIVASGGTVVEALRYKPEGRGIDSRWCHWNFSLT
jgi:hypothetical protein